MDKNQGPGSGVSILDPQHWFKKTGPEDHTLSLERYGTVVAVIETCVQGTYGTGTVPIVFVLHGS
jgi:hypothetical protein